MRFKDQFIKSKPLLIALLIIGISCQFEKESTTPESVGLSSDTLKLAEAKMQIYYRIINIELGMGIIP